MGGNRLHLSVAVVEAREEEDFFLKKKKSKKKKKKKKSKKSRKGEGQTGAAAPQRREAFFFLSKPQKFLLAGSGAPSRGPSCPWAPGGPSCPQWRGWLEGWWPEVEATLAT